MTYLVELLTQSFQRKNNAHIYNATFILQMANGVQGFMSSESQPNIKISPKLS